MQTEPKHIVSFYRGDMKLDEWCVWGKTDTLLSRHQRMYPALGADRIEVRAE